MTVETLLEKQNKLCNQWKKLIEMPKGFVGLGDTYRNIFRISMSGVFLWLIVLIAIGTTGTQVNDVFSFVYILVGALLSFISLLVIPHLMDR